MSRRHACPRRDGGWLQAGVGVLGEAACPKCQGRLFAGDVAQRLFDELGVERALLLELAAERGGERLPCPVCGQKLDALPLRGESAHLCTGCGSLWLPVGALARLTDGHHREVPAVAQEDRSGVAVLLDEQKVDPETLVRAVIGTRLAGVDARQAALREDGVVSLQLTQLDADVIVERLAAAGVGAQAVEAASLELPVVHELKRLRWQDDGLVGVDSTGKELAVRWDDVRAVAVGRFETRERVEWRHLESSQRARAHRRRGRTLYGAAAGLAQAAYMAGTPSGVGRGRVLADEVLVVVAREPRRRLRLRLSAALWEEPVPGDRRFELLREVVRAVRDHAPSAACSAPTRAYLAADSVSAVPTFDDERAFDRDLLWSLWRAHKE